MRATRRVMSGLAPTIRGILETGAASSSTSASSSASASTSSSPSASSSVPISDSTSTPSPAPAGQPATVSGWIRTLRAHKKVAFAELDDGSGSTVQAVLKGKARDDSLTPGAAVRLRGTLTPSRGAGQAVELLVDEATLLGACDPETYPIQKKALPASVLREHAHLRFRTSATAATMRVRDALARDWHDWFEEHEFVHIHTPLLTSSDCEGAGEVFTVAQSLPPASPSSPPPFFPKPVNLTVSGQLHIEAPTHALGRTYTLSPAFRAEPSQTSRHLAEFYMLEAEVAFVDSLPALLDVVEASVRDTVTQLLTSESSRARRARGDIARIRASMLAAQAEERASQGLPPAQEEEVDSLAHLHAATQPFARLSYIEAIALLEAEHKVRPFDIAPSWDAGLASEHEKWLSGVHFARPTFVTDYPAAQKPFYMLPSAVAGGAPAEASSKATVAAFDLLFPGIGEMAGGSLREHRLDALEASIRAHGLAPEEYEWYLDLRRFGSVPHGGWGMGWERWVCWITGLGNVRDVVAFPRWAGSCRF